MNEAKIKVGDQWFYRGNRANSWFATYREGGGLSDRVPTVCWPFLEEIARLQNAQPEDGGITHALVEMARENAIEECAQVADDYHENIAARIRRLKASPQQSGTGIK